MCSAAAYVARLATSGPQPLAACIGSIDRNARIAEARELLGQLRFDAERCNERSALVLLALLALTPEAPWSAASNPLRRTVEIMAWLRERYAQGLPAEHTRDHQAPDAAPVR